MVIRHAFVFVCHCHDYEPTAWAINLEVNLDWRTIPNITIYPLIAYLVTGIIHTKHRNTTSGRRPSDSGLGRDFGVINDVRFSLYLTLMASNVGYTYAYPRRLLAMQMRGSTVDTGWNKLLQSGLAWSGNSNYANLSCKEMLAIASVIGDVILTID